MRTIPTTASIAEAVLTLAERQREITTRRAAQWGPLIAQAPAAMCSTHPGQPLDVDVERSAFESARQRRVVIVCHECPACAADAVRARMTKRLIARGLPPRSVHITLETWNPDWEPKAAPARRAAWKAVDAWAKDRQIPFLVILGGKGGTGKTALGVAALKAVAPSDVRCVEYRDLMADLLGMDADERGHRIRALRQYRALMIDDFGNRHIGAKDGAGGNAFERDVLASILHHRFEERLPTIVTSNLSPVEFAGRLDDRTVDRIRAGRVVVDAGAWPSRRAAVGI